MPRKRSTVSPAPRTCNSCSGPVTSAGRKSASGLYWCRRPECVAAKQRHAYARIRQLDTLPEAPRTCSCCGDALSRRKVRLGDHPEGRWCRKLQCQKHRALVTQNSSLSEEEKATLAFTKALAISEFRVYCEECGLVDAVKGFVHPKIIDGKPARCTGVGEAGVPIGLVQITWPDRYPS